MLGTVQSPAAHPIRKLFDAGVIVTVTTDDVLVFGQGVSEEFLRLFQADADELERIRLAGLTDPRRQIIADNFP
jgi:adenosine deaminase